MRKENKNQELKGLARLTVLSLIGIGTGLIANELNLVGQLIEYFGGTSGTMDSYFEIGIPTVIGINTGFYYTLRYHNQRLQNKN